MRAEFHEDGSVNLWLSAHDTWKWAQRWPCSQLRGKRVFARFSSNGDLEDMAIDGRSQDCDANEFNAITQDYLAEHPRNPRNRK